MLDNQSYMDEVLGTMAENKARKERNARLRDEHWEWMQKNNPEQFKLEQLKREKVKAKAAAWLLARGYV